MAILMLTPDGLERNGHTVGYNDSGELYTSQIGYVHRLWPWWTAQSGDSVTIATNGGVMDLQDYGPATGFPGSYSATFHGGFFQFSGLASDIGGNFNVARTWVYGCPSINSHDQKTVDLSIAKYHYSTGWQSTGLASISTTVDPARGPRMLCTGWWDIAGGSNGTDVPHWGLRNNASGDAFYVGAVWLEFAR